MAGQVEFMEAMKELERIGETNGNQLSMEEITQYFMEMELDETQFDFICKYFESHHITITNRVKMTEEIEEEAIEIKDDPLDAEMVELYTKEAEYAPVLTEEEMEQMAAKSSEDDGAKTLLIEANLSRVIALAKEYQGKGLLLSDLIQEGNIGMVQAVNDYEPGVHGTFCAFLEKMIRAQMEEALGEYNESTRSAMRMATKVNRLNDIATAFAKEFEREAKPQELAERMGITEDEVKDLMKVSLDAIAVLDESKMGN